MTRTAPRRLSRLRRMFRFRVRTLLLLMLAAAIGVKWWMRPEPSERVLPGGVRVSTWIDENAAPESLAREEVTYRDRHGRLLAHVRRSAWGNKHHWTYYHLNGQRRLEGGVRSDCRRGVCTTWDVRGVRRMEITYGKPLAEARRRNWRGGGFSAGSFFAVDDDVARIPETSGDRTLRQFGGGGMGVGMSGMPAPLKLVSNREGAYRRWSAEGALECRGQYENDRRHGVWTFYDSEGRIAQQGEYRRGAKHGWWTVDSIEADQPQRVYYCQGRRIEDPRRRVVELARRLRFSAGRQRWRALREASAMGGLAAPALAAALTSGDVPFRCAVLRALGEMEHNGRPALRAIERAAASENDRLRREALLALAAVDGSQADFALRRVLLSLEKTPRADYFEQIGRIVDAVADDLAPLEVLLYDERAKVRLRALDVLLCAYAPSALAERLEPDLKRFPLAFCGSWKIPHDWRRRPAKWSPELTLEARELLARMKNHPRDDVACPVDQLLHDAGLQPQPRGMVPVVGDADAARPAASHWACLPDEWPALD